MVPSEARGDIPTEQQISAGDLHRPERDPNKLIEEEGGVHEQTKIEE